MLNTGGLFIADIHNEIVYSSIYEENTFSIIDIPHGRCLIKHNYVNDTEKKIIYTKFDLNIDNQQIKLSDKNELRCLTSQKFKKELIDNGFRVKSMYGGWNGVKFKPRKSERIVGIFEKPTQD